MALLDTITELIDRPGSEALLRDHLALANEKYAMLEQKAQELAARVARLESENVQLRSENGDLRRQQSAPLPMKSGGTQPRLDEGLEAVLVTLAQEDGLTEGAVARRIGVGEQVATYRLEELKRVKMVGVQYTAGSDWAGIRGSSNWSVAPAGRRYLVEHGLIR